MVPFAWGLTERTGGTCASFALPGVGGGDSAVDVDHVSGRLSRARASEEGDRFGHVFRINTDSELRSPAIEALEVIFSNAIRAGAFRLPVRRPDAGVLDHGIWVDGVDTNTVGPAFLGETAGEVERSRLRRGVRGGVRPRDECVFRSDEDKRTAASLLDENAERL